MCEPTLSFPLALISLHQWGLGLLDWDISYAIQWHGYLTGSGLSLPSLAWEWDWLGDAAARTLIWASPVGARLHWEVFGGCGQPSSSFAQGMCPQLRSRWGLKTSPVHCPTLHLPLTKLDSLIFPPSVGRHCIIVSCHWIPKTWAVTWDSPWSGGAIGQQDGIMEGQGGGPALAWVRRGPLMPLQPTPPPRKGSSPTQLGLSFLLLIQASGARPASGR